VFGAKLFYFLTVSPVEAKKKPFSIHGYHDTSAYLQQLVAEIRKQKSALPLRRGHNHNFIKFPKKSRKNGRVGERQ
jgi:hypothetical protein